MYCYYHAMPGNRLSVLTRNINILQKTGEKDPEISGLAYDSRRVKHGNLFFALRGMHTDGHNFIPAAIERGAAGIVYSNPLQKYSQNIVYIRVKDTRTVLSPIAAAF
ncbi:MAG: Mur ligase domain-containing protein, partial [Spirochaetota bacterium]